MSKRLRKKPHYLNSGFFFPSHSLVLTKKPLIQGVSGLTGVFAFYRSWISELYFSHHIWKESKLL